MASSSPDTTSQSPELPTSAPSPIHEAANMHPASPPTYTYSPQSSPQVSLPSASTLLPRAASHSPPRSSSHPVAILPKPSSPRRAVSESSANAPLRLDCDVVPSSMNLSSIDKERLRHIYDAHRASFWGLVAQEYGGCVSPFLLEEAWKRGIANNAPPTPCISPVTNIASSYQPYDTQPAHQPLAPVQEKKYTTSASISSLLGIVSLFSVLMLKRSRRVPLTILSGCQPNITKGKRTDQDDGGETWDGGRRHGMKLGIMTILWRQDLRFIYAIGWRHMCFWVPYVL